MADIRDSGVQQLIEDSVDYLMSGPAGLGQNFSGASAYTPAYLTGTVRAPFIVPITTTPPPQLTINPIAITNITVLAINDDGQSRNIQIDFTPQANPPFQRGQGCLISGVDPDFYDGFYGRSIVSCTTSSLVLQSRIFYTWPPYVSGGDISLTSVSFIDGDGAPDDTPISVDTFGTVTVTGPTDIVFVSSQTALDFTYTCTTASEWDVTVKINRYSAFPPDDPLDPEIIFAEPVTISEQTTHYSESTSGSASAGQNIFTTVLDTPSFGFYRYFAEVYFYNYNVNVGAITGSTRYNTGGLSKSGTTPVIVTDATYTGVIPTSTTGIGSGATMDITIYASDSTVYSNNNVSIEITYGSGGTDYEVGDILTVSGTDIGAASPANDLTLVVQSVIGQPYPGDAVPDTMTVGLRSLTAQVIKQ
jgi:hypothetical protein